MESLLQDLRYGIRMLVKSPGFSAVAILTLALGIGANTAIFTLVNAVFLHPIPVHEPERLVSIFTSDERNRGALTNYLPTSHPNADDIRERAQSFSGVLAFTFAPVSMTINGEPQNLAAQLVSGNYFDVLGVNAVLGRTFRPDEDSRLGAGPVIVLSHGLWVRRFSSDPNVIGKNVLLNGQGFSVAGVAPPGFQGTGVLGGPDMWIPMSMHDQVLSGLAKTWFSERRYLGFFVLARLKPGVTPEQARAELHAISTQLEHDFPTPNKGRSFTLLPLLDSTINPNVRGLFVRAGGLMMTVVGLVLLIACANIANLLLARASGRKREISIRLALGASRRRIIVQLLTEALVLSLIGGALGLGIAVLVRSLLWQFRPPFLQQTNLDISLDIHVLTFTLAIAVLTGIFFGLVPAVQTSRPNLVTELKDRDAAVAFSRFGIRGVFVVVEFALSLVALIGAGLFVISLRNAQQVDPGFDTNNLAMLSFNVGSLNYDAARQKEFDRRLLELAQSLPGVRSATLAANVPLFTGGFGRTVLPEGQDANPNRSGQVVQIDPVAPGYLPAMGIPLVSGEAFTDSLREDGPKVAIINETAARHFWPGENPVGKRFKFIFDNDWTQVIGVAKDSKYITLGEDPIPYVYLPLIQNPTPALTLFFRSNGDPKLVLNSVRSRVQELDRNLPLTNVWPIGEVISQALWGARFAAGLLAIFALLAVVLASIGIYGVVSYSVGQRVREIGIRMALGAQPGHVLRMILNQSAVPLAIGLVAGVATAFAMAHLVSSLLLGVSAHAPLPFIVFSLCLAAVGMAASYFPARRATKVDPMLALRYE